jgi:hypothetical protein
MLLPVARNTNITTQDLKDEILIYDFTNNKAYCLNPTSTIIYNACNGKTSFEDLEKSHNFKPDLIFLALDELKKNDLVEDYNSPFVGISRREIIRKVGLGSMVALPVISSLIAPKAIDAQSGSCPMNPNVGDPSGYQGLGGSCLCTIDTVSGNSCGQGNTGNPANSCRTSCVCTAGNDTVVLGGTTYRFGMCG